MEELKEFIMKELPNSGVWWHNNHKVFTEYAEKLLAKGVEVEFIKEMFKQLYSAVAEEYGD